MIERHRNGNFAIGNTIGKLSKSVPKPRKTIKEEVIIDYVLQFFGDKEMLDTYLLKLKEDDVKGWTIFTKFMDMKLSVMKAELERETTGYR